jgi:hypothetical protein
MSYYDSDSDSDDADSYYPRHRKPHYPDRAKSVQCSPDPTPFELDNNEYPNPTPLEPNYHGERHNNGTDRKDETCTEWETESEIDEGYEPEGLECENDEEYTHEGMEYETGNDGYEPEGPELDNGEGDTHRKSRYEHGVHEHGELEHEPKRGDDEVGGYTDPDYHLSPHPPAHVPHSRNIPRSNQ